MQRKKANWQFGKEYVNFDLLKPISIEDGLRHAVAVSGRSSWAIMVEMLRLRFGPPKIDFLAYFKYGLFRSDKTFDQKCKYVPSSQTWKLTRRVSPKSGHHVQGIFKDKILFNRMMNSFGFKTPELQLYIGSKVAPNLKNKANNWQELKSFFENNVVFPVFCKPIDGLQGLGAVSIVGIDLDAQELMLGNDKKISVEKFCRDIFEYYERGYMIESFVQQEQSLTSKFGPVPVILRVVTVKEKEKEPEFLYTYMRGADAKAMGTLERSSKIIRSVFDAETGEVVPDFYENSKFLWEKLTTHGVDGEPFKGFKIPHAAEAIQQCIDIHTLFPGQGWIGFDIIITEEGPLFVEGNASPACNHAQVGMDCGILDGKTGEILERVIASRNK